MIDMRAMYMILATMGWAWTVIFFVVLWFNTLRRRDVEKTKGFDVITK